jgi:hypothetical protein
VSGFARIWAAVELLMPAGTGKTRPASGNNILLPRALDSDRDDALPDGQTVCTATEFVDHTDGFDSGYGGELRGESVSAADGMQIAGMDRYSCHPDPDLAGTGLRNRAGLQVQNLGRFA